MKRVLLVLLFVVGGVSAVFAESAVAAASQIETPDGSRLNLDRTVVLFYSERCPHCHSLMAWYDRVRSDFPDIEMVRFEIEVVDRAANQPYFEEMMAAYDSNTRGWPRTIIGDRLYIGFSPETGPDRFNGEYQAWIGYRNRLYQALETLQARAAS